MNRRVRVIIFLLFFKSDFVLDDRLWVDIYEPTTEVYSLKYWFGLDWYPRGCQAELAVHKKKVEDVRRWFLEAFEGGPSGRLKKYRVRH